MKTRLEVREWFAIFSVAGMLTLLTFITTSKYLSSEDVAYAVVDQIAVAPIKITIEGAVQNPGEFLLDKGALLKDALQQAKPLPSANLKNLKLEVPVKHGQHIKVKERPMIRVVVDGAVESVGEHALPKGTRLNELGNYVKIESDADLGSLSKRRYLRDAEHIHVPHQKK